MYTLYLEYDKNMVKFETTLASGYNLEVWVYDKNSNRIDTLIYHLPEDTV